MSRIGASFEARWRGAARARRLALCWSLLCLSLAEVIAAGPPTVTYFSPTGGPPGTQVTVVGSNFINDGALDMQVAINGQPANVLKIVDNEMTIAVSGALDTSGTLRLTTSAGTATTSGIFLFSPLSVQVNPEHLQIFAGASRAISAVPIGTGGGVQWTVNGIAGGNATLGTVTQNLATNYTAPASAPDPATVLVSASLAANPAIRATARVVISDSASAVPDIDLPDSDPADFSPHPDINLLVSRTRVMVLLQEGVPLGSLAPALRQLNAEIIGGAPEFNAMEIAVPDPGDLTGVGHAIDVLSSSSQVLAATYDSQIGTQSLPEQSPGTDQYYTFTEFLGGTVQYQKVAALDSFHWDATPNGDNWGLEYAAFPAAWNLYHYVDKLLKGGQGERQINVGVVDGGLLATHVDLAGHAFRLSGGSAGNSQHGTHVSGIIAANWTNKRGIVGASPFANIYNQPGALIAGSGMAAVATTWYGSLGESLLREVKVFIKNTSGLGQPVRVINYSQGYNWESNQYLSPSATPANHASRWKWGSNATGFGLIDLSAPPEFQTAQRTMVAKQGMIALRMAKYLNDPAHGRKAIIVASAGNDGTDIAADLSRGGFQDFTSFGTPGAPDRLQQWLTPSAEFNSPFCWAAYNGADNVFVVEALDKTSDRTDVERVDFSDVAMPNAHHASFKYGFSAPGVKILSASVFPSLTGGDPAGLDRNESYEFMQGTSQAAPHVSGLIAYLCSVDPALTIADIHSILVATSHPNTKAGQEGGAPAIDAYKAVMNIDEINKNGPKRKWVKKAMLNIDDGTPDGDDRTVARDLHGSGLLPTDMKINMADFRRFRDAWLQTQGLGQNLNGPASLKRDLNENGLVESLSHENIYPREDFDGDGKISENDLNLMADPELWDDEEISAAGLDATGLKNKLTGLLQSGDYKIDADAIFADPQVDNVVVKVRANPPGGSTQTYSIKIKAADVFSATTDSRKIITVPSDSTLRISATAFKGTQFRYFLLDPKENFMAIIHAGEDKTIAMKKADVKINPPSFTVAYNDRAAFTVDMTLEDGTHVAPPADQYAVAFTVPAELGSVNSSPDGFVLNSAANPGTFRFSAVVTDDDGSAVNPFDDPAAKADATVRTAIVKNPGGLALDGLRNLYVTDTLEGNVLFIPPGDAGLKLLTGLDHPGPIDVDPKGRSLIVGEAGGKVTRYFFGLSGKVVDQAGALVVGANVFVDTPAGTIPGTGAVPNRIKTSTDGRFTVLGLLAPEMGKDPVKVAVTIEYNGKTQAFPVTLKTTGQTILEFKLTD